MQEECLICKAPLEYLETDELMECEICHMKENSKGIISISNHRFSNDPGIRCAILPDSIRELGVGAFSGCVNLESVKLNEGLKRLKKDTFSGCIRLENVHLPDTLESIGEWAFRGCASLKKIVIPNNVREICAEAFLSCPDLTIIAEEGSFAAAFAEQNGIKCIEVKDE